MNSLDRTPPTLPPTPDVARTLYRGGMAAIVSEVLVVIGLAVSFGFASQADLLQLPDDHVVLKDIFLSNLQLLQDNYVLYIYFTAVVLVAPAMAMLIAVWAWHQYFVWAGVGMLNNVATSMAIVGVAILFAAFGVGTWGFGFVAEGIDAGTITEETGYIIYLLSLSFQGIGVLCLYVLYPALLVVAGWQRQLLPRWLTVLILVLVLVLEFIYMFAVRHVWLIQVGQSVVVVMPFLLGVAMLRRAQALMPQHDTVVQRLGIEE